jgi:thiol-disulfide isomerase/thioredoxin
MNPIAARLFAVTALVALVFPGCGQKSESALEVKTAEKSNPRLRLVALAERYQAAKTYQDAGELRFLVDGAPEDEFRSLPFSVTLDRPNRLRIHVLDTTSVADGKMLRSVVQSLPGQVLLRECPSEITVAELTSDEMLDKAMHGQLGVDLPQLLLLIGDKPLETITRDSTPEQLSDSEFQGKKCWRIALAGPAGKSILWIEQNSGLLVKYEFPLDDIRKQFPLARLWAEFRGATLDEPINPVAFQMELPEDVKLVKRFVLPPPQAPVALLAKPVDKFTFVALDGTALGSESLAGKVVVLDMWATWCGWCFEGLPLLEKVYQQYRDNDQIVFLAVSKDESSVSNNNVEEAFKKHNLTIPIVRDQDQITDRLFELQGLPTTIVLGRDGTVQDYHVGYDPELPNTLPTKLDKLLAGENLAQPELDAYEQQKAEFEKRLSEVLVESEPSGGEPEVASKPEL